MIKYNKNSSNTEDDKGNCFELSYSENIYIIILTDSDLGGEQIHILIMNKFKLVILNLLMYGSLISFGSRVREKYIENNTYTGIRSNFRPKLTPTYEPVHKYDLNYLYLRSDMSRLPEAVAKELIYRLSQKDSYSSIRIDSVINGFSLNEVKSFAHL